MSLEISSGPDWDLRLHKTGRFALRWNKRVEAAPDGCSFIMCSSSEGKTLSEVFAGLFRRTTDEEIVLFRSVLVAAQDFSNQAGTLQRKHSMAISLAVAASKPRRLAAALALLADGHADEKGGVL